MREANFFLVVRFWIAPGGQEQVMRWLEGGHINEVLHQPGFLWMKRLKMSEPDPTGWSGHAMIYGIESKVDYERYMANHALHAKFTKERESFATKLRIERFAGEVDLSK